MQPQPGVSGKQNLTLAFGAFAEISFRWSRVNKSDDHTRRRGTNLLLIRGKGYADEPGSGHVNLGQHPLIIPLAVDQG